ELTIDELKTHQRERPVLRSETPAGIVQEIYGLLLAHYVVRVLMFEAAQPEGIDPRRLSFTGTLKILRCRLPQCPRTAEPLARWYKMLLQEIATEKLPARRNRINPRVIPEPAATVQAAQARRRRWLRVKRRTARFDNLSRNKRKPGLLLHVLGPMADNGGEV